MPVLSRRAAYLGLLANTPSVMAPDFVTALSALASVVIAWSSFGTFYRGLALAPNP